MKKAYSIPSIEIEEMATQEMLAVSPDVTLDKEGSVDAANVDARGGWFDDEEE